MFDRCITFAATYYPEDGRLTVECLNSRNSFRINVLDVCAVTYDISSAVAHGIREYMKESRFEDFFEVK